jgi:sulfite reductase alpha subunit-like flavoprotein
MWDAALKLMPLPPGAVIDTSDSLPPSRYLVSPAAAEGTSAGAETSDVTHGDHGTPTARRPFMSLIVKNEVLTAAESEKEVLHLELDIEGSGMRYQPGDIVAIQPRNADEQVQAMAEMCDLDLDASVTIVPNREAQSGEEDGICEPGCGLGTVSVRDVLTRHLDFMATPRRRFFQLLPFFCADEVQRERLEELASKEGRVDLYDYCHKVGRSGLEVLRDFPAARPPLHYLMELMPGLRPRLFSISSGPSCTPGRLSITVGIVDYKSKTLMHRRGVCSGFLKAQGAQLQQLGVRQDERGRVPIWIQEGSLRLPQRQVADKCAAGEGRQGPEVDALLRKAAAELATPLVLVGPGTGLAPLRSFLQERSFVRRRLVDETGPAGGGQGMAKVQDLLFFGCRRRSCDYLYRHELEGLLSDGHLRHLGVAFSRDQPHKVYVQDKIREAGALVWSALEAGAVVMISGASEKMPRDVREAFVEVVKEQSGQGGEYAEAYVRRLESQRRYLLDTWS